MSAIRDFFKKKKADLKFQTAGRGHKLNESVSSAQAAGSTSQPRQASRQQFSEGAQRAGAAALARLENKQTTSVNWSAQATKAQARKEIESEIAIKNKKPVPSNKTVVVQDACPTLTVSGVYFTCPMIGPEVLPKDEIKEKIRRFLYEQLEDERGLTACLLIHTVNQNREKVRVGVETLARYLTNIIDNPTEEKFRRIRVNNKIFQERIVGLEGAFDFLEAAGFTKKIEEHEEYFVYDETLIGDIEHLQMLKEALLSAEPIIPVLDRNQKVLQPAQATQQIKLPNDFFNLSAEELKREQELKSETVELLTTLRTKAMRERDEVRELHLYKYTLIRVRFPDGIILQGTFYVHERLSAVRDFVSENLEDSSREFQLLLPGDSKLTEDGTLLELRLVPAVLLNFLWSRGSHDDKAPYLKAETMVFLAEL